MTEKARPGFTLPAKEFGVFDAAIKGTYGKGIAEIAQAEPAFAFQAMRVGLKALFSRRGHGQLVEQSEDKEGSRETVAVTDRSLDGETAFAGTLTRAMDDIVDRMVTVYEESDADFPISVVHKPGLIGRLLNQQPTEEVVAVIPQPTEE